MYPAIIVFPCSVVTRFYFRFFSYSEIQDNTISKSLIPVDMLRLKLSFFGATRFDPRSDRWVRITMYQGAPLMKEINLSDDTWSYKKIA